MSVIFVACSDPSGNRTNIVPAVELFVSELPVLESSEETADFHIRSTVPWSIEVNQDWCIVSPIMGTAGETTVSVSCTENKSYDERNAAIIVRYGENQTERLLLVQKQQDALLLTSNKVEVNSEATEVTIGLQSNVSYSYEVETACASWISLVENRALQNSSFTLKIDGNSGKEKREGKVWVKGVGIQEVVHVYQEGFEPVIVLSANRIDVGAAATEIAIEVKSNFDYEVSISPTDSWIQMLDTRYFSSYTHRFHLSSNESYDSRTAEIKFLNKDLEKEEIVTITQMQQNAILIAQCEYTLSSETNKLQFDINTNVEFMTHVSVDWIHVSEGDSRGMSTIPLMFSVDQNPSAFSREGVITISYKEIHQDIRVVQNGWNECSRFFVTFKGKQFSLPIVIGKNLYGVVDWGDGTSGAFTSGKSHTYESVSEYQIAAETSATHEILFKSIEGIQMIDLIGF